MRIQLELPSGTGFFWFYGDLAGDIYIYISLYLSGDISWE